VFFFSFAITLGILLSPSKVKTKLSCSPSIPNGNLARHDSISYHFPSKLTKRQFFNKNHQQLWK